MSGSLQANSKPRETTTPRQARGLQRIARAYIKTFREAPDELELLRFKRYADRVASGDDFYLVDDGSTRYLVIGSLSQGG